MRERLRTAGAFLRLERQCLPLLWFSAVKEKILDLCLQPGRTNSTFGRFVQRKAPLLRHVWHRKTAFALTSRFSLDQLDRAAGECVRDAFRPHEPAGRAAERTPPPQIAI